MVPLKVAFVGSGGAARGLAHLGVLKACEEIGIVPTIFVGTSAGALVASTYGQDIPLDVLLDAYRLPWRRRHQGPRLYMSTFLGAPRLEDFLEVTCCPAPSRRTNWSGCSSGSCRRTTSTESRTKFS